MYQTLSKLTFWMKCSIFKPGMHSLTVLETSLWQIQKHKNKLKTKAKTEKDSQSTSLMTGTSS